MDQWNHKGIHGAVIVSMEPLGYINGYRTYLADFKCFYCKYVSRNPQCILGTTLWIHGYIYNHDECVYIEITPLNTMKIKLLESRMKHF